jgi:hypothetical protein
MRPPRPASPLAGGGEPARAGDPPTGGGADDSATEAVATEAPTAAMASGPGRPGNLANLAAPPTSVSLEPEDLDPDPAPRRRGSWTDEPLPTAPPSRVPVEPEEPELAEDDEPGVLDRVLQQLRGDPYIAVMAGLGALTLLLLVVFLIIRK